MINAIEGHNVAEGIIIGMIKSGISPRSIITGLHNASVHGKLFDAAGWDTSDDQLKEWLDGLSKLAKYIEELN